MKASQALQILAQVPGSYPLEVEISGQPHQVLALEYSHEPARAVVKAEGAVAIDLSPVREITTHKVNPANDTITLLVLDEPGAGGANHEYLAAFTDKTGLPHQTRISFQNGPIAANGVNGLTQEVLLAIVIDRLEAFQRGPFACKDNDDALGMIKGGLTCLLKRTQRRMAQGVEGTHEKHAEPTALPDITVAGEPTVIPPEALPAGFMDSVLTDPSPFPDASALPEPEATIAELNGEVPPVPVPVEPAAEPLADVSAEPDAGEVQHARIHPEEVAAPVGTAPAKKTRRAKAKPAALPPSEPETT